MHNLVSFTNEGVAHYTIFGAIDNEKKEYIRVQNFLKNFM